MDVGASRRLPAVVDGSRAQRGGTGNLRLAPSPRCLLEPAGNAAAPTSWPTCSPESQACPTWSGHHGIPATVSRRGPRPIGPSGGTTPGALCPGGRLTGRRRAGHCLAFPVAHWQKLWSTQEPEPRDLTWWASSPTGSRHDAWWARCWPNSMTNGPKPAAAAAGPICWKQPIHQKG